MSDSSAHMELTAPAESVRVRDAGAADLSAIAEIYNQGVADGTATSDLSDFSSGDLAHWLRRGGGRRGLWVAEDTGTGEVLGWVALWWYHEKPCFRWAATFATYVARQARGRRVGTRMRTHMIERARAMGYHALVNRVFASNHASIALAERFGFRRVGYMPELAWRDGRFHDCVFFQLILEQRR
jgi:phosphinothricin acetyltransferase